MMAMFKSVLTGVAMAGAMALASGAMADGMPGRARSLAPAPFSWTGFYVGANIGGAWSEQNVSNTCTPSPAACAQAIGTGNLDGSGVIGGIHAGFNWTVSPGFILGVEGDWSFARLDASAADINRFTNGLPVGSGGHTLAFGVNWLASLRARAGVTLAPNLLAYVTGGFAWMQSDLAVVNAFAGGCPNCTTAGISSTRNGYALGAGLEWAMDRNWILRAEYMYYGFEGQSVSAPLPSAPAFGTTTRLGDTDIHSVRAGISYKF